MAFNAALEESILLDFQNTENNKSVENATNAIKNGFVNFCSTIQEERKFSQDYAKIMDLMETTIKKYANSQYKFSTSLEPNEIEQVKKALNSYVNSNEKVNDFKRALLEDLTEFQHQILLNHKQRIIDTAKEKETHEKQIRLLECAKNKLIMDRLSQIIWPYDEKTKAYDIKIAQLQAKIQQIENQKCMRPAANERDILMYKMHLKEKFAEII